MAADNQPSPTFHLIAIWTDRLVFETGELTPKTGAPDERPGTTFTLTIGAGVDATAQIGQVTLKGTFAGHTAFQPYKIEIDISGQFKLISGKKDDLLAFLKVNAPVILFPYMREAVHRVSKDGKFGGIALDPINISGMFADSVWSEPEAPANSNEPTSAQETGD